MKKCTIGGFVMDRRNRLLSRVLSVAALLGVHVSAYGAVEAPTGFDNDSIESSAPDNQDDLNAFDKVNVTAPDGLGPVYNAQACRECHQNPVSGAASQITEVRAGHLGLFGQFVFPNVQIVGDVIKHRTLINDRAICENAQEHVPILRILLSQNPLLQITLPTVTTQRLSLNLFGDGFVEAIPDADILKVRNSQCNPTLPKPPGTGAVCGIAQFVEVLEAPGEANQRLGRFGWKNEQASLLSFASDAYLNEMGITNRIRPDEVTKICNPQVPEPNDDDKLNPNTGRKEGDIDRFARFMRSRKAPPRFTPPNITVQQVQQGEQIFKNVGCEFCHTQTFTTIPAGTVLNPTATQYPFQVTAAHGDKIIHPFSDFLMHNAGTGDGIALSPVEHYGLLVAQQLLSRDIAKIGRSIEGARSNGDQRQVMLGDQLRNAVEQSVSPERLESDLRRRALTSDQRAVSNATPFSFNSLFCNPFHLAQTINEPGDQNFHQIILCAADRLRTPPLWGLHERSRLMHDGASLTPEDAIARHGGEAAGVRQNFNSLPAQARDALLAFLKSL